MSLKYSLPSFGLSRFGVFYLGVLTLFIASCDNAPRNDADAAPSASTSAASSESSSGDPASIKLSADNAFKGITDVASLKLMQTPDGLKIHADTYDPHMVLPRLQVAGSSKWSVHVQLVSPNATAIQIFYDTIDHPKVYNEAHSVRKPIQQGDNDVVIDITDKNFGGNIRLDPGDQAGDYLIKLIEVTPSR